MCGIVGIWHTDGSAVDPMLLDRFTDTLAHRGPDGRGTWIDPAAGLGLGHRRLAILDLSARGGQPMADTSGRYRIVLNGEIYNFLELRRELAGLGHRFKTETDTEVALAAYIQWGPDCQQRFNGMWALGIWDRRERTLFLSRDRFGVKPLHYHAGAGCFAFASEVKAFLALPQVPDDFDPAAVATTLSSITLLAATETCLLKAVRRLEAGHCLTLRAGQAPRVSRWWCTLDHLEVPPAGERAQTSRFRELFSDACRVRMRSDVPVATALSGGLDSGSVLATMAALKAAAEDGQRSATDWQRAFVACFPGTVQDERGYADAVVAYTNTQAVHRVIDPAEVVATLDRVVFQVEDIYDNLSAVWLLYREMQRAGIRVSMDGHGGDELLAGYMHYPEWMMRSVCFPLPRRRHVAPLRALARQMYAAGNAPPPAGLGRLAAMAWWDRLAALAPFRRRRGLLQRSVARVRTDAPAQGRRRRWLRVAPAPPFFAAFEADGDRLATFDPLTRRLYYDFHCRTLPPILRNFDRCAMAHGVESRAPFMDWRLVCYGFSLPPAAKIHAGRAKWILREAMVGRLPEVVRQRQGKLGFVTPLVDWLAGPLRAWLQDMVHSRRFVTSPVWNGPMIRDFVDAAVARKDFSGARQAWEFIQAMRLMELFAEVRRAHRDGANHPFNQRMT